MLLLRQWFCEATIHSRLYCFTEVAGRLALTLQAVPPDPADRAEPLDRTRRAALRLRRRPGDRAPQFRQQRRQLGRLYSSRSRRRSAPVASAAVLRYSDAGTRCRC